MDERLIYVLVRFTETNVNYFAFSKQKQQSLEYSQAYQPYEVYFKRNVSHIVQSLNYIILQMMHIICNF